MRVERELVDTAAATAVLTRRPDDPAAPRRLVHRLVDPLRWDDVHQRLAAQAVFRWCTRSEIRQVARAGDECVVPAGTIVCREDRIGYWFFVVIDGALRLSKGPAECAILGPGSHVGDIAILGFGPQPMTVTAVVDSTVFVLGRRHVIDLSYAMANLQRGLFPEVAPGDFQDKVRDLRRAGSLAWRSVPREVAQASARSGESLPIALRTFPSRGSTSVGPAFARLFTGKAASTSTTAKRWGIERRPLSARVIATISALVLGLVLWLGLAFHPGVLVVRPGSSLDVTDDIEVVSGGMPVRPPSGRYILTAVSIDEPNLFGTVDAMIRGSDLLPGVHGDALIENRRLGRAEYLGSQQRAARLVAERAGLSAGAVEIRFRDRQLAGPSAGLLYALLLSDITGQVEVEPGRVVAATGMLDDRGRVLPVGFVDAKWHVAKRSAADVFLVPAGNGPRSLPRRDGVVVPVTTLDEAMDVIDEEDAAGDP